jgi:general secretion pathway protein J
MLGGEGADACASLSDGHAIEFAERVKFIRFTRNVHASCRSRGRTTSSRRFHAARTFGRDHAAGGGVSAGVRDATRLVGDGRSRRTASAAQRAHLNEQTGIPLRFLGESDRIRFVADLPNYLGRGGPHLHDIRVVESRRGGLRLEVGFAVVMTNEVIEERQPRPPEVLADGLREVRFRYRSLTPDNRIGEWQDRWEQGDRLPLQVSIEIIDSRGEIWPPMVVSLPQAASFGGSFSQAPI